MLPQGSGICTVLRWILIETHSAKMFQGSLEDSQTAEGHGVSL